MRMRCPDDDPHGSKHVGKTCKVTNKNKIKSVHLLGTKFTSITKMHGATHIKVLAVCCHVRTEMQLHKYNRESIFFFVLRENQGIAL
jgi:hypothetical protein